MATQLLPYLDDITTLQERLDVVRQYIFLFEDPTASTPQKKDDEKTPEMPKDVAPTSDYPDHLNDNIKDVLSFILPLIGKEEPSLKNTPDHLFLLLSTSDACVVPLLRLEFHKTVLNLLKTPSDDFLEAIAYFMLHGLPCPQLAPIISQRLCELLKETRNGEMTEMKPNRRLSLLSAVGTLSHRGLLNAAGVNSDGVLCQIMKNGIPDDLPTLHTTVRCIAGLVKHTDNIFTVKDVFNFAVEKLKNGCDLRTEIHLHSIVSTCARMPQIAQEVLTTPVYFSIIQSYVKSKPSRYSSVDIRYFALQTLIIALSRVTEIQEETIKMCESVVLALPSQPLFAHLGADVSGGQHPQMLGVIGLKALCMILMRMLSSKCKSELLYTHIKRISVENVIATIGRCTIIDEESDDKPPVVKTEIKNDRETALYWGLVLIQKMFAYEQMMGKNDVKTAMTNCEKGFFYLVRAVKCFCGKTPDICTLFVDIAKCMKFDTLKAEDNKSHYVHRLVQLMRDFNDSCFEHGASKALFGLCELGLIEKSEIPILGKIALDLMKKFSLLTPDNVETVYSLVYIISEVDYTSDVCGEIVKLAISDVLPWICDNQTKITSNDEDIEKYDFLVLVLLVLFCKTTMTEKMKNIVQQVRKVYGSEAGEITEYCDKLLN